MNDEILQILLNTLKLQAEKYEVIVGDSALTHEQRKEFDTEIKQMHDVLVSMTNSSTTYTLTELQGLKTQFEAKLNLLSSTIQDLELNTLNIEFSSLSPSQKDSLKGEKGDKGDKGLTGSDGQKGEKGDIGLTGLKGDKGDKGETGDIGLTGLRGASGEKGEKGDRGEQGQQGITGDRGIQGYKGDKGDKGDKGEKGDKGSDGFIGSNGIDGKSSYQLALDAGFSGSISDYLLSLKGASGLKGEKGDKGENGQVGLNVVELHNNLHGTSLTYEQYRNIFLIGDKGETGDIGLTGEKGEKGDKGEKVIMD